MPAQQPVTVYLVDASPYIFRAHFSLPDTLRDAQGARTGAVYGFAAFLLRLIASERPSHLAVAFDRNLNGSFRNDLYPPYKAQRQQPPPELVLQIPLCLETAEALGAATFIDEHFEADDLIATLCHDLAAGGHRAVIVSADKDLAQLVSAEVTLYDFARAARYGVKEVRERLGVSPDQVTDLLGLAGDPVDNIPGVRGVGRKTAAELLAVFPHLEELYEQLDALLRPPWRGGRALRERLVAGRELAFLSRTLATLSRDATARVALRQLAYAGADKAAAAALLERLGLRGIGERVASGDGGPRPGVPRRA
jgi:DNA polymerase-1